MDAFKLKDWVVEPALYRLRQGSRITPLEPKLMKVLVALARNPGKIISREELTQTVWPDTHVTESLVRRSISELRRLLGDNAKDPIYIATIPKAGYRLIAAIADVPDPHHSGILARLQEEEKVSSPRRITLRLTWVALLALGLALATGLSWVVRSYFKDDMVAPDEPVSLHQGSGLPPEAVFSSDGNHIAFVSDSSGSIQISTQRIGWRSQVRTFGLGRKFSPVWSGEDRLYYGRELNGAYAVMRVSLGDHVYDATDDRVDDVVFSSENAIGSLYLHDSELLVSIRMSPEGPFQLVRYDLNSDEKEPLTMPPARFLGDLEARVSPDSNTVAFIRAPAADTSDIFLVPRRGGEAMRLTFLNRPIAGLDWSGNQLIFSVYEQGSWRLWQVVVDDGEPQPLAHFDEDARSPRFSINGSLIYERLRFSTEVRRTFLKEDHMPAPYPFISSDSWNSTPRYAPDGKHIAFMSTRAGPTEIWMVDENAGKLVPLTSRGGPFTANPAWAPDSRRIAFETHVEGSSEIFFLQIDGGLSRRLTRSSAQDVLPSWSHDGKAIFFASDRLDGWQVWKVGLAGGRPEQVTRDGGYRAVSSADGRYLYYSHFEKLEIWRMPLEGGAPQIVITLPHLQGGNWSLARNGFYFVEHPPRDSPQISFFDFNTQKTSQVRRLQGIPEKNSLDVSADGNWLLFSILDSKENEIVLIRNFAKP